MPQPASEPIATAPQLYSKRDDLAGGDTNEPLVCAVCLTHDRPEMTKRAVECFRAQTYGPTRRYLVILDTGEEGSFRLTASDSENEIHDWRPSERERTVGSLRNYANAYVGNADVIVHWDSDDWSHPARIAEQVALLQSSGKECVGYRDMLFWRPDPCVPWEIVSCTCGNRYPRSGAPCPQCHRYPKGEAWLFTSGHPKYCLGTSLCYWRWVWERLPFEDVQTGEDYAWLKGVDSLGERSHAGWHSDKPGARMIASIHGGNTSPVYKREYLEGSEAQRGEWRRVPAWDSYCRGIMEGECSSARL